jgi:hypothetical protein
MSEDLFDEVTADWTGFKRDPVTEELFDAVAEYVQNVFHELSANRVQETAETVLREHVSDLRKLRPSAKLEVQEFVTTVM